MISVTEDCFPLAQTFTISRGSKAEARVLTVRIDHARLTGWGECVPYARYGETVDSVRTQIEGLPQGITRAELQSVLPAGAARNAVDCALWDLAAKQAAMRVWDVAGLARPTALATSYTLSLAAPDAMREAAMRNAFRPILKVKLGTPDDLARLQAVRAGAPKSTLRTTLPRGEGFGAGGPAAPDPGLRGRILL